MVQTLVHEVLEKKLEQRVRKEVVALALPPPTLLLARMCAYVLLRYEWCPLTLPHIDSPHSEKVSAQRRRPIALAPHWALWALCSVLATFLHVLVDKFIEGGGGGNN